MSRLLLLLLAVSLAFFASTVVLQRHWRLPDNEGAFGGGDGWTAAVRRGGSRLWPVVKGAARRDHSVWAAVAVEAAGAANEGVGTDSDAVQHLRNAFQQRANLTALQQAQHERLERSRQQAAGGARSSGESRSGGQRGTALHSGEQLAPRRDGTAGGAGSDSGSSSESVLSDPLPGDGSSYVMPDPAIVLFCYNRPLYLEKTLASLAWLEGLNHFSLYISQDGGDPTVRSVVRKATRNLRRHVRKFEHWQRPRTMRGSAKQTGDAWLTQHYRWGLDRAFLQRRHSHVIVLEDDMLFSPDFLTYFQATALLLEEDPTLWCISSWNDNSRATGFRWNAKRMLRTSYFPGLGWLLRKELWTELSPQWPVRQWDQWMRLPTVSLGRDCVAPEVNRNRNFGERGANMERETFNAFIANMTWHTDLVRDFGDLSYLVRANYEAGMRQLMQRAQPLHDKPGGGSIFEAPAGHVYLVTYRIEDYADIAGRQLKIWPFPRAHFQHIALLPYRGSFFLLADVRACPLLPEAHRIFPTPGMLPVVSQRDQSCTTACSARGWECAGADFWFINSCEALRQHFPCENGCAMELGPDVPNYVQDPKLPSYHQCLVTQRAPLCSARHAATSRLCPCGPRSAGAGGPDAGAQKTLAGNKAGQIVSKDLNVDWLTN